MLRSFIPLLCLTLLSCSSAPSKPPAASNAPGVESLLPLSAGAKALGGALEVVSVTASPGGDASYVVLRATSATVQAFVHPRWFADASLKREFRAAGDDWLAVRVEAGNDLSVLVPMPYPFAGTLGLDVAKSKPAAVIGEGRALPGRLVVTPEQAKQLAFYQYPDLKLSQYESMKHAGAPKLAVWRNGSGKVVAAVEIYVRADAKPAKSGLSFLHTNGKPEIGTSLAYSNSKKGGPAEDGWEFVVFRQGDREVAVPWKPLVKNASFLGACMTGVSGLDATQLGDTAQIGTIAENGAADMETVKVETPSWSMANPTGGSLSSGAPVQCQYSGPNAQRWSIETGPEMTITGSGGGGHEASGTLPSGSGSIQLGTLRASRPGKFQFLYTSEDLHEDPTCEDRLTTSDGPVCPGEDPAASTEIVSDAGKPCSSDVPGCTSNPIGEFVELVIPCSASIGTCIRVVKQEDEEPGFVATACDGETLDGDMGFMAVPFDEDAYPHTWIEIDNGAGVAREPACRCVPCKLVVVIGELWHEWPAGNRNKLIENFERESTRDFDYPPPDSGDRDPRKAARHRALLGDERGYYTTTEGPKSWGVLDPAISAAQRYSEAMAAASGSAHFHVLHYKSLGKGIRSATRIHFEGTKPVRRVNCRSDLEKNVNSLTDYFENCHKWDEILFIYHGVDSAFPAIVSEFKELIKTPVKKLVFWSCWGGELINADSDPFKELVAHLQAGRCNCPPRRPGGVAGRTPNAGHEAGDCDVCPVDPLHCPYEGTIVITAANLPVTARLSDKDPEEVVDISVPLGIDYVPNRPRPETGGTWVLTSADGLVNVFTVPPEGPVAGPTKAAPRPIFGDTRIGTEESLRQRGIDRNQERIHEEMEKRKKERKKRR